MSDRIRNRGVTRRDALKRLLYGGAGLVFGGASLALAGRLCPMAWAGKSTAPAATTGKAKAVIQIWMWGGPCHLDTFDPKPDAGRDYCGALNQAIETNVGGIRVNAALPQLAKQADKYSIIRSVTHGVNGHETASYIAQTGHTPGMDRLVYPSVGAVVSKFKGYDQGYEGMIPPYIVMTRPLGRFSEVGLLGLRYKPFVTGGDPNRNPFAVEGIVSEGVTKDQQKSRRRLLGELDTLGKAMPDDPRFKEFEASQDKAYELILGDGGKVFDLSREDEELRNRYGRTKFGQSCLAARRLVESGVPYVSINYEGWDTHKRHFETMNRKLPEMDRGFATLLEDLSERGLLDSTIVWWGGEFGRTPKVQWQEPWNGGRSHYGNCYSVVVAGGGFKGGQVVGASDSKGEFVADRPVHPRDVIGSMYELLGIDPDGPLPNGRGLEVKVLPPAKPGSEGDGRVKEITA